MGLDAMLLSLVSGLVEDEPLSTDEKACQLELLCVVLQLSASPRGRKWSRKEGNPPEKYNDE
jgi:hypothetical protein